ncbi:MAG TPA: hypothetical protein VKB18_00060 [Gemmatimonadota bacterium]|nr:hypothetical protein [Gemmatimonadota bacterium]
MPCRAPPSGPGARRALGAASLLLALAAGACGGGGGSAAAAGRETAEAGGRESAGRASALPAVPDAARIDGVTLSAPVREADASVLEPIVRLGAGWIAVVPFAFGRPGSPELRFDLDGQYWGERTEGVAATIRMARAAGLRVMVKPQVWVRRGWTGDFDPGGDDAWSRWEASYTDFVLAFARVAEREGAGIFCLGTELGRSVRERPAFWRRLADTVRAVYGGKLTYAANWDEAPEVPFWSALDYVGIDAYYPLSTAPTPTVADLARAWRARLSGLEALAARAGRPILFTEFGYRSADRAAGEQWRIPGRGAAPNPDAQAAAYEALFRAVWERPWFAGGFVWKWRASPPRGRREGARRRAADYTIRGKPAEEVVRRWYGRSGATRQGGRDDR